MNKHDIIYSEGSANTKSTTKNTKVGPLNTRMIVATIWDKDTNLCIGDHCTLLVNVSSACY